MVKRLFYKILRIKNNRITPAPATPDPEPKQDQKKTRKPEEKRNNWTINGFIVPPTEGKVRFHDLNIHDRIMHAIQDQGFEYCTPIQAKVLAHSSLNHNIAGRAQTGTGKTAAFLITLFSRFLAESANRGKPKPGCPRALILAPTRELVMQIEEDAKALTSYTPFRTLAVYGGSDIEKMKRDIRSKPVDVVAATPGRLIDLMRQRVLDLREVEILIIDEADRMLDMGFIPDVRRIIRETPPKEKRQTMLFSATLTDEVLRLASQWMPAPVIIEIAPEQVTVDTVEQVLYTVEARHKFRLLYNILQKEDTQRILIFGNRRTTTQRIADNLRRHGIDCEYLSGAVKQDKRIKILEGFKHGKIKIVVATDVAGRGIHVDNVSHVINYEFPYDPENYVHRIGRTGRAGVKGRAISFACEDESFVIPEIEEYIGRTLRCTVPEEELLQAPPPPSRPARREEPSNRGGRPGGGRPGGGRPGGGRSSGRRPQRGPGRGNRR